MYAHRVSRQLVRAGRPNQGDRDPCSDQIQTQINIKVVPNWQTTSIESQITASPYAPPIETRIFDKTGKCTLTGFPANWFRAGRPNQRPCGDPVVTKIKPKVVTNWHTTSIESQITASPVATPIETRIFDKTGKCTLTGFPANWFRADPQIRKR